MIKAKQEKMLKLHLINLEIAKRPFSEFCLRRLFLKGGILFTVFISKYKVKI